MIEYVLMGVWTLDVVFLLVMECKLFSGCVVREGAKKKITF